MPGWDSLEVIMADYSSSLFLVIGEKNVTLFTHKEEHFVKKSLCRHYLL